MIWLPSSERDVEFLRQWIRERLDTDETFDDGYTIAILSSKKPHKIKCCFVVTSYTGNNIIISGAIDSPWVAPREVAEALHKIFSKPLSVLRITALIHEMNKRSVSLMEHLGFIHEGTLRDYEEEGTKTLLYGLTKSDFYGGKYGRYVRSDVTGETIADAGDGTSIIPGSFWNESPCC